MMGVGVGLSQYCKDMYFFLKNATCRLHRIAQKPFMAGSGNGDQRQGGDP
jgi:hypothetical protein